MISEIEYAVYVELKPIFLEYGFVLLTEKKQFRKNTDLGFQNIVITSSTINGKTWIEVNFGCRHNALEQIVQQFLDLPIDFQSDSNTLIISIGKFNDDKYFHFEIETETDIKDECNEIAKFFIQTGFQFLNTISSIQQIDKILNEFPNKNCKYIYNQTSRFFKGIVAAKLTNKKEFINLVDVYRMKLLKNNSTEIEQQKFEKLYSLLVYQSLN